ncbi:MAG: hydroxyacylglutathione hydrolase [Gammaproteobacteria bacterium]|nr:MAG: hydroxyacylglutathione hydrolase [Gammaproteobacteria bacterium]
MTITLQPLPALSDNYIWLIINTINSTAVIIDPGAATVCVNYLKQQNIRPTAILVTHHHWDHVDGIERLVQKYDIPVYGPATEDIPCLTSPLTGNDRFDIPELTLDFQVIDLCGHTAGHIGYLTNNMLFCGDTLFSAGCGRLYDGTAEQLHAAIQRIARLPTDTSIYCGHEYTLDNLRFALAVEPENAAVKSRVEEVKALREKNQPSLPVSLENEMRYNPFLRTDKENVMKTVAQHSGQKIDNSEDCFRYLRLLKDRF